MNRRDVRKKPKYLVRWKEYTAKEDAWEKLENLGNMIDLVVEEFKKKIREKKIKRVQIRKEKVLNSKIEIFKRSKLSEKYTVKILFG